jgi:hypothetical protein
MIFRRLGFKGRARTRLAALALETVCLLAFGTMPE